MCRVLSGLPQWVYSKVEPLSDCGDTLPFFRGFPESRDQPYLLGPYNQSGRQALFSESPHPEEGHRSPLYRG